MINTGCKGSPSCGFPKEHHNEGVLMSGHATRAIQAGRPFHLLNISRDEVDTVALQLRLPREKVSKLKQ